MINLFFVLHDHFGARTYADELLSFFSGIKSIRIYKVFFESRYYNEYKIISVGGITEIHLPSALIANRSLEKYSDRCIDLMDPLLVGKENMIFHLNYATQVKFGIKARERYGSKLIYTLHFLPDYFSFAENEAINELRNRVDVLELDVVQEVDRVICVTRFAKNTICQLCQVPENKIVAIHNGFGKFDNSESISDLQKKALKRFLGFNEEEQIILFVGALEERKGLKYLIRAFNTLSKHYLKIRLVIVGSGNFADVFNNAKGCWGKITLTGKITLEEVYQLYQIATLGVIPSVYEQCSYVALEMMKHALPVVVAAAPGLRELYTNGENALVVPLHKGDIDQMKLELNEDKLTEALTKVLNDKILQQKLKKNARSAWERFYTVEKMGDATIKQYKKLLWKKESANKNKIDNQ